MIKGEFRCYAAGPNNFVVDEIYNIDVRIPPGFPRRLPQVFETGGRIPQSFHHLETGALCLGAPISLRLAIERSPTIGAFLDKVVTPYLYAHAYYAKLGIMPFGELPHGAAGLEKEVLRFFRMPSRTRVLELLQIAGLRRREGNKKACPCGSGRRVGRCHNARINVARRLLGRAWFRGEAALFHHQRERERQASLARGVSR